MIFIKKKMKPDHIVYADFWLSYNTINISDIYAKWLNKSKLS